MLLTTQNIGLDNAIYLHLTANTAVTYRQLIINLMVKVNHSHLFRNPSIYQR